MRLSVNIIEEDGALRPLAAPAVVGCLPEGAKLLYVHQHNFIMWLDDALYWQTDSGDASPTLLARPGSCPNDIAAVGNTLVAATDDGLHYALWKDNAYTYLGERPPFASIEFGMERQTALIGRGYALIPERIHKSIAGQRVSGFTAEELADYTTAVYAVVNSETALKVTSKGLFHQSCMIRYAYRLYDGSHAWHSSPVLLAPTVLPPFVKVTLAESDSGEHNALIEADLPHFRLMHRIVEADRGRLEAWKDIIAGIDIFCTTPIYTYDQGKDLAGATTPKRSILLAAAGVADSDGPIPARVFAGHYGVGGEYIDHYADTADTAEVVPIMPAERFADNLRSAHSFYKIAELPLDKLTASAELKPLELNPADLRTLGERPSLADDYDSHAGIGAKTLYGFNGRVNAAGIRRRPAAPLPIRSAKEFGNPPGISAAGTRLTVWTRHGGVRCKAVHDGFAGGAANILAGGSAGLPRYLFYPDPAAYRLDIELTEREKYSFPLTPHDFLNGAYYLDMRLGAEPKPEAMADEEDAAESVELPSKIYTSEPLNPFAFPAKNIATAGNGRVVALSSAAKALSEGQFGLFPLYAFTDEGIWALQTTAEGGYSAVQPLGRDVLSNPRAIVQLDNAVAYATAAGIMVLSGSKRRCITDELPLRHPDAPLDYPGLSRFAALGGASLPPPLASILGECRLAYDYPRGRIIAYAPGAGCAYVYSLRSGRWAAATWSIEYDVNSYPATLAVDPSGRIIDLTRSAEGPTRCVALTEPLKMKMPCELVIEGCFVRGTVKTALWGSRTPYAWHLIASSTDHRLNGLRGSAYRRYAVGVAAELSATDFLAIGPGKG